MSVLSLAISLRLIAFKFLNTPRGSLRNRLQPKIYLECQRGRIIDTGKRVTLTQKMLSVNDPLREDIFLVNARDILDHAKLYRSSFSQLNNLTWEIRKKEKDDFQI